MAQYPQVIRQLLEGATVSLAAWYAVPLAPDTARAGLAELRGRLAGRYSPDEPDAVFAHRLAELILREWVGQPVESMYQNLCALLPEGYERAQLELACGQLLMARRRLPAWRHLDRGFRLAAHLLDAQDYFVVLKRHELLRHLPLGEAAAAPAPLEALLAEARVIDRLQGRGRPPGPGPARHLDTLD